MDHSREHRCDIAVRGLEGLRHLLHELFRLIVRHKIGCHLSRQMRGGGGMTDQQVKGLVYFGKATSLDSVAEKNLVAVIVARRIELERALAHELRLCSPSVSGL